MKISATYTELGGPWGYGHQEPFIEPFEGSIKECIKTVHKAVTDMIESYKKIYIGSGYTPGGGTEVDEVEWEVKDYLRHTTLYVEYKGKEGSCNMWSLLESKIKIITK